MNILADDPAFETTIQEAWSLEVEGCAMFRVWRKLNACKKALKALRQLSKSKYSNVDKKVIEAREMLATIQQSYDGNGSTDNALEEKKCLENMEKRSSLQENIYKQKSRDQWVQIGDGIDNYFIALMKANVANKKHLLSA